jgi:hypothetical protein
MEAITLGIAQFTATAGMGRFLKIPPPLAAGDTATIS